MKKNRNEDYPGRWVCLKKILLVMKLMCVCTLMLFLQASGITYSQKKVNLNVENVSMLDVIQELRKQTGFKFFFNHNELKKVNDVSAKFVEEDLERVLDALLREVNFAYRIEQGVIIITPLSVKDEVKDGYRVVGFVTDEHDKPMPGVTVILKGTSAGTATNNKGYFGFTLPMKKGRLLFTFVGYKSQEIPFEIPCDTVRIKMKEDMEAIDEVVVRAYGTQNKREVVSSISSVTAEEMKELPSASILSMLQGRLAGVNIVNQSGAPGSASVVAVRGFNSLLVDGASDGQPLYVIDGVPMHSFVSPVTGTNTLADIDPSMIESVEVLKDAAAASIYGSRAGNGVILITTKKGRAGDAKFSVNISYTGSKMMETPLQTGGRLERWYKILKIRNTMDKAYDSKKKVSYWPLGYTSVYENKSGVYDGFWQDGHKTEGLDNKMLQDSLNPFYNNQTNWWKHVFRTGKVINGNVQASGGSDRFQYMIGGGFYTEDGIMLNSSYSRVSLNLNLTAQPTEKLRLDARVYGAYMDRSLNVNNGLNHGRFEGMIVSPSGMSTLISNDEELQKQWLEKTNETVVRSDDYRGMGSVFMQYTPVKGLDLSWKGSIDLSQANRNSFKPSFLNAKTLENVSEGQVSRKIYLSSEVLLRYKTSIKEKHNLEILLGMDVNKDQVFFIKGEGRGQASDYIYYYNAAFNLPIVNDGTESSPDWRSLTSYNSDFREKAMVSYFGRFGYNYKQRYLFEGTLRRDGSSTFGEDHKWATFPSVAVGWAFSEEKFMDNFYWLDWGKIRASYGTSGQIFTDEYLAHGLMQNNKSFFMGQAGMSPATPISPDLTWEKSEQYNIGLDFDMFDYRLSLKLDYYYKYTSALIYSVDLPGNMLIGTKRTENAMEVSNEGLELELKADVLREKELRWRIRFNVARNWNRFEKSYSGKDMVGAGLVVGRSINGMYVYIDDGYYQSEDEVPVYYDLLGNEKYMGSLSTQYGVSGYVGTQKIRDLNGDGRISDGDMAYCGSPAPLAHGGWANELSWRNFSLNLLFNFVLGRDMINTAKATGSNYTDLRKLDYWKKPGDETNLPKIGAQIYPKVRSNIENVHSVSLKQITLGYDLPKKMAKKAGFNGVRFFGTIENLFYLSNYSGMNPELVDVYKGIDNGTQYPLSRKMTLGLTLNF
ncbi:MAG: SusC/RagA family TonB-linked outer membrane protein [Butyricimonas synergistica]|nr:MAG: SusC/RagA family TonB-linked outer membrane protein [Butyricimonas synergistica]